MIRSSENKYWGAGKPAPIFPPLSEGAKWMGAFCAIERKSSPRQTMGAETLERKTKGARIFLLINYENYFYERLTGGKEDGVI
ncbi:MAG: hypothetical protein IKV79_02600 [Oscillospiraceae bacterium]|nr:hypothetical protein [Oscillospiraceae bacterium]